MKLIYAQEKLDFQEKSIFLAGPTPRSNNVKSWRSELIKKLKKINYNGIVLIPEMRNPDDWKKERNFAYDKQIKWEEEAMQKADIIVFWIPRKMDTMPALTTNIEFGYWYAKNPSKLIIGIPKDAEKCDYIRYKAKQKCIFVETMNDLVNKIKQNTKTYILKFNYNNMYGKKDPIILPLYEAKKRGIKKFDEKGSLEYCTYKRYKIYLQYFNLKYYKYSHKIKEDEFIKIRKKEREYIYKKMKKIEEKFPEYKKM